MKQTLSALKESQKVDEKSVSSENVMHPSDAWISKGLEKATTHNVANKEKDRNVVVGPGKVLIYDTTLRGKLTKKNSRLLLCCWEPLVGRR